MLISTLFQLLLPFFDLSLPGDNHGLTTPCAELLGFHKLLYDVVSCYGSIDIRPRLMDSTGSLPSIDTAVGYESLYVGWEVVIDY